MPQPRLTAKMLRTMLSYDPKTGVFAWKHRADCHQRWNTRYAGKQAGYDWKIGAMAYRSIRIFDWPFLGHRLAVLYVTGRWPRNGIDHKDRDGLNNRWANLRPATKAQNAANSGLSRANTSGYKGVNIHKGKIRATIRENGRQRFLGHFPDVKSASVAYQAAARKLHGEFAQ